MKRENVTTQTDCFLFSSRLFSRSSPRNIQTTSTYASSVLCTLRIYKERTNTSRRRDTRRTSWYKCRTKLVLFRSSGCESGFGVTDVLAVCQEKQEENELRALPPASAAQLRAVDAAVLETARQHGISQEDFDVRSSVVARMEEIIKEHLSGRQQR